MFVIYLKESRENNCCHRLGKVRVRPQFLEDATSLKCVNLQMYRTGTALDNHFRFISRGHLARKLWDVSQLNWIANWVGSLLVKRANLTQILFSSHVNR